MKYFYNFLLAIALVGCAATPGKVTQKEPVTPLDAPQKIALDGYDATAYFTHAKPTRGSAQFEVTWRGARWQFESATASVEFMRDPERYAPQYGGYCAYATAHGFIARGDPEQWAIVDHKLYVNNNEFAMALWDQDRAGHIVAADVNWPLIPKFPLPASGELSRVQ